MDVGRFFSLSAVADNGVLALLAAVVVLLVLVWALSSPFWEIPDEPSPADPAPTRPAAGPGDATSPLPRAVRVGSYAGPRHAAGPPRPPKVSGGPPWGPAPRPPSLPPAGWLYGPDPGLPPARRLPGLPPARRLPRRLPGLPPARRLPGPQHAPAPAAAGRPGRPG